MNPSLIPLNPEDLVIKKHSIKLYGHPTSVTLEPLFWEALKTIAADQNISLRKLIEAIDANHPPNLSSALRVYVLRSFLKKD